MEGTEGCEWVRRGWSEVVVDIGGAVYRLSEFVCNFNFYTLRATLCVTEVDFEAPKRELHSCREYLPMMPFDETSFE